MVAQAKVVKWFGKSAVVRTADGKLMVVNTNGKSYPGIGSNVYVITARGGRRAFLL